jgi:hypothetical protein
MASPAAYISFIREEAEKYDFSFYIRAFREVIHVFDEESGKWQQPIVDALVPVKD